MANAQTSTMTLEQKQAMAKLKAIRLAAQQTKLAKKVFLKGANALSGAQLAQELRLILKIVGINAPVPALVGLDAIQIILSGGALVSNINSGASILQCAGSLTTGVAGITQLFADLGIVDKTASDFVGLASNTALVLSSGGTNILADVGLVLSLFACIGDLGGSTDKAKALAMSQATRDARAGLATQIHAWSDPQISAAIRNANAYAKGDLNPFDFIANVALESPIEFRSFFPQYASYFPSWINKTFSQTSTVTAKSKGLLWSSSSTQTHTESYTINDVLETSEEQVRKIVWQRFFLDPIDQYTPYLSTTRQISLKALSVLSMIASSSQSGSIVIDQKFDILSACAALGITPARLGDDWLFKGFLKQEKIFDNWTDFLPYKPLTQSEVRFPNASGLVINGRPQYTQSEKDQSDSALALARKQVQLQAWDQSGDIASLMNDPEGLAILKAWANWQIPGVLGSVDVSDYWKCLQTLDTLSKSKILGDVAGAANIYGRVVDVSNQFNDTYAFSIYKNLNLQARKNVAKYTGIPIDKLGSMLNKDGSMVFYKKAA